MLPCDIADLIQQDSEVRAPTEAEPVKLGEFAQQLHRMGCVAREGDRLDWNVTAARR